MRSWKSSEVGEEASVSVSGPRVPSFLAIAEVRAPFGASGEVRAEILTDFPKRFARLKTVYLGDEGKPYPLERARVRGGEVLLKLGGVETPEQADKLRTLVVQVPTSEAMPLPTDHYYHYQILGMAVFTSAGECLGRVAEILPTGGNDVYVVRGESGEMLLPAIVQVIRQVDVAQGRMVVELMEGMRPEARGPKSRGRRRPPEPSP